MLAGSVSRHHSTVPGVTMQIACNLPAIRSWPALAAAPPVCPGL